METTYKTINLSKLVNTLQAWKECKKTPDTHGEWIDKHLSTMEEMFEALPHGSGLDRGVEFDFENSTDCKLIFNTSFHHLNENGYYDGWTDHKLIITPSFNGFSLRITGPNKRDIKEYLSQMFYELFIVQPYR